MVASLQKKTVFLENINKFRGIYGLTPCGSDDRYSAETLGETTCCWACTELTETAVSHFLRVCSDKQQVVSGEKRPFLGIKTANGFVSVGWKDLIMKNVSWSLLQGSWDINSQQNIVVPYC